MKKKIFSLKLGLVGIVVLCWLLPILLIIMMLTYYTSSNMKRQFNEAVHNSVINSAYLSGHALQQLASASRYINYDGTIYSTYKDYIATGDQITLYNSVSTFLVRHYRYDESIYSAILFLADEPERVYHTQNPMFSSPYLHYSEYMNDVHTVVQEISAGLDTGIGFHATDTGLYMIRNIVDSSYEPYAVIVLKLNTGKVFAAFANIMSASASAVYLNDVPVAISGGEKLDQPKKLSLSPGTCVFEEDENNLIVRGRESLDGIDMLYTIIVDRSGVMSGIDDFHAMFYFLIALLFPLLAFAVWFFYRNIFRPITFLSSGARLIQNGQLGYQVTESMPNTEFQYLNDTFNRMSVRLKHQFMQLYTEEMALRDARIMALQSQINPHFLNNTLEIINWEARLGNNGKVSNMIEALATMLDAAMDRRNTPIVTLNQELMYLDAYLYIISERFGKRLVIQKEIDRALMQYKVPRLIMQPILENAIEHGVAVMLKGEIIIRVKKLDEEKDMILEVENNTPLSKQDEEQIKLLLSPDYDAKSGASLHLGIHNVNMRLQIIYGQNARLEICGDETRTVSRITIPLEN